MIIIIPRNGRIVCKEDDCIPHFELDEIDRRHLHTATVISFPNCEVYKYNANKLIFNIVKLVVVLLYRQKCDADNSMKNEKYSICTIGDIMCLGELAKKTTLSRVCALFG